MTPIKMLIIEPGGEIIVRDIEPTLTNLQHALGGGYLEGVTLDSCHLYCDEEGKLKGLPINTLATVLAHKLGWPPGDMICGRALFFGNHPEGAEADVPTNVIKQAREIKRESRWDEHVPRENS